MRLLCFGDSNTYGYDPRSYFGDRYPADFRWADQLAAKTGWEVLNFGMNGRSIPAGAVSLPEADCLMVMLGSNDLLCGASAAQCARRTESFLRPQLSRYPHILLVSPPPMKYGDWVTEDRLLSESALLADQYHALAEMLSISFADAGQWKVELTFDGVHFSELGHLAFCDGLSQVLNRIM